MTNPLEVRKPKRCVNKRARQARNLREDTLLAFFRKSPLLGVELDLVRGRDPGTLRDR
jgi:hypothetical protein